MRFSYNNGNNDGDIIDDYSGNFNGDNLYDRGNDNDSNNNDRRMLTLWVTSETLINFKRFMAYSVTWV